MPGWYIHMDVARKALVSLASNSGAASILGSNGFDADTLTMIAQQNPAYVALGAIGPDIFFLLPDFKPPAGSMLWGAANTIKDVYTWWDDNFLGPYEATLAPIANNFADELAALTGGLSTQLSDIFSRAFRFLLDTALVLIVREFDVFSLLGSGVPAGYDEQTFFWSDMLHYRKTYEFAAHLWKKANVENNDRFRAFALGWMTHLATDVTGHSFVNEKSGGPYRLHWQRHHLVENHMDAKVYDSEHGRDDMYQMLPCAALHLWIAFNPDGSSRANFFKAQPGPAYPKGDKTPDILDRHSKWDVDSDIPDGLAQFLAEALREVYNADFTGASQPKGKGQWAAHPTILKDVEPSEEGYVNKDNIATTYWWLYHYVKYTTTDYFKMLRPEEPDPIVFTPFSSPPGSGTSDPGPGASHDSSWLEKLLGIIAWITYLSQVAALPPTDIAGIINSAGSYPIRKLLYATMELPLYNAWLALHWYFSMAGYTYPMQQEINPGLTTLGTGVGGDCWTQVLNALDDPAGGLITPPPAGSEPSGMDLNSTYPLDVVLDPPDLIVQKTMQALQALGIAVSCQAGEERPSEFERPWLWPAKDNAGNAIPPEYPQTTASPYRSTQDATALLGNTPGHNGARTHFEQAQNEAETHRMASMHLSRGEHLGDPIDYAAYVVAQLTRDHILDTPGTIANFNLDADRGYAYLCWDWVRSHYVLAAPSAYRARATLEEQREYQAPLQPGYGWCDKDILSDQTPQGSPRPLGHNQVPGLAATPTPTSIRYLDREEK